MVLPFMHLQACGGPRGRRKRFRRSVAQWLEHRSPKPGVGGSSPSTPARRGSGTSRLGQGFLPGAGRGLRPAFEFVRGVIRLTGFRMATSPFKFFQEVREETRKVTWPSRKETAITTAMVFVMVAIASVFFLVADQIMRIAVTFVLGIGG